MKLRRGHIALGASLAAVVAAVAITASSTGGGIDVIVGGTPTPSGVTCTTTLHGSGSVSSALSGAAAGAVICLDNGSYTYASGTISKSSPTTVQATGGAASRDSVTITGDPDLLASHNLTFKNVTIAGFTVGTPSDGGAAATNLEFDNIHYSNCFEWYQGVGGTWNVTMDGGLADMSAAGTGPNTPCADDGRFLLRGFNDAGYGTSNVGFTIKNIKFSGTGHCTDGLQMTGGQTGVTIGPGNEFTGILEGTCSTHADSLQIYGGGLYSTITGNYFHGDDFDLSFFNSTHHLTVTNNAINQRPDYPAIWCGWCDQITITHNTVTNDIYFKDYTNSTLHDPEHSSGTVEDNVLTSGSAVVEDNIDGSNPALMSLTTDYNLQPSGTTGLGTGAHDVYGSPTFAGGSSPSTWAGYALSCPGSTGCGAAHDASNMGIAP